MGDSSTIVTFESSPLNDDLFARELDYQASMSIAEGLLRRGLMTDREVRKAKVILLAKYRPPMANCWLKPVDYRGVVSD